MSYHVHVAFGFHVNCYHSYRGDTNDALGFGGDIRIIRHILDTLDERNRKGIPVKGTWDFENAFSLESVLPRYAPDIIERVRERQANNGDENILMGYNNGALSAMTEDEFEASLNWAIRNERGSGLEQLFGGCEKIVRPQEVMFTPSQVSLYKRLGIRAVCLYYSCISFDAFRTLIPQLPDALAFNPLRYVYRGEGLTVIPTYSPNDIMDAGSLRALCVDLHRQQLSGEIGSDVLIFLNTDADSFLWEPMAVPGPLKGFPCFGGIGGYIDEVADLPWLVFDTPGGYLKSHGPAGDIAFGQDVADGNLSGYCSWAEKPFNRLIWTRLERARAMAGLGRDRESPSFETRVRLLSTTHFGLASPVMNVTREEKALKLSETMLLQERQALPRGNSLTVLDKSGRGILALPLSVAPGMMQWASELRLACQDLEHWTACETARHPDGSIAALYLVASFSRPREEYRLELSLGPARLKDHRETDLEHGRLSLDLLGFSPALKKDGRTVAELKSWIDYDGRVIPFDRGYRKLLHLGGDGEGLRLQGVIRLPGELEPGSYVMDFFTVPGLDCFFARCSVQYPYTKEDHEISTQASNLGRYSDPRWRQTAPFEWTLKLSDQARVTKRNFMDDLSFYPLSDFWRAFPQNENISSINHQLTGGVLSVSDEKGGLLLSHARQVLGSMAHCPLRLQSLGTVRQLSLNPFGSYFGPQRYYPSRGNGSSMELYLAAAPQARPLAPAYNGAWEQSVQALFPMDGLSPDDETLRQALAIADGAVALDCDGPFRPFEGDNVKLHQAVGNRVDPKELKSVSFAQQIGGSLPMLGLVKRYTENLNRAQKQMRKSEKEMKGR